MGLWKCRCVDDVIAIIMGLLEECRHVDDVIAIRAGLLEGGQEADSLRRVSVLQRR